MSGVFKALGKVFRKVASAVKKIAIPALIAGAVIMTGGAALGAGPLLGAGGAAAGGGGIFSSLASAFGLGGGGAAAGGGGLGGLISGIFGGGGAAAGAAGVAGATGAAAAGGGGLLGGIMSSPLAGSLISGAASGWAAGAQLKEEEQQAIRADERTQANYAGVGDATDWNVGGRGLASAGLIEVPQAMSVGNVMQGATDPVAVMNRPNQRPGLNVAAADAARPRAKYDREAGRIIYE